LRAKTAGNKVVSEGVHKVEDSRGTVWIPP
jgi:hypothetical protein